MNYINSIPFVPTLTAYGQPTNLPPQVSPVPGTSTLFVHTELGLLLKAVAGWQDVSKYPALFLISASYGDFVAFGQQQYKTLEANGQTQNPQSGQPLSVAALMGQGGPYSLFGLLIDPATSNVEGSYCPIAMTDYSRLGPIGANYFNVPKHQTIFWTNTQFSISLPQFIQQAYKSMLSRGGIAGKAANIAFNQLIGNVPNVPMSIANIAGYFCRTNWDMAGSCTGSQMYSFSAGVPGILPPLNSSNLGLGSSTARATVIDGMWVSGSWATYQQGTSIANPQDPAPGGGLGSTIYPSGLLVPGGFGSLIPMTTWAGIFPGVYQNLGGLQLFPKFMEGYDPGSAWANPSVLSYGATQPTSLSGSMAQQEAQATSQSSSFTSQLIPQNLEWLFPGGGNYFYQFNQQFRQLVASPAVALQAI